MIELRPRSIETVSDFDGAPGEDEQGLVWDDNKQIGHYHVVYWQRGYAELRSFGIYPEFQRRGYGRQAAELIRQKAERQGQKRLYLEPRDTAAEEFWGYQGYKLMPHTAIMERPVRVRAHRRRRTNPPHLGPDFAVQVRVREHTRRR
mgnify:CR=1 FL=1